MSSMSSRAPGGAGAGSGAGMTAAGAAVAVADAGVLGIGTDSNQNGLHPGRMLTSMLKRTDEKWITERAYENPKFVEDMVRDVAGQLAREPRIDAYVVESENFEE